jgi:stearoyl-CoA desaturase (delta-9 desaturase)
MALLTGFAVTAGSHRLFTHRTYKASLKLKIFLAIFQTASYEYSIFRWTRDHRMHHKFIDTDADPYNA